ncbi:chitinase [Fusarium circinatum]|uniref:Chitinase n=1 Tax=Fusarium circinatum TaxID=48490 RepID=A0A8H5WYN8_FUSCI|nr:chitinase [Fusarium circinatum]
MKTRTILQKQTLSAIKSPRRNAALQSAIHIYAEAEAEASCFEGNSDYSEFTLNKARQVIGSFCDSSYTLEPDNIFGQNMALEEGDYTVIVSAKWELDPSHREDKEAFSFAGDD